MRTRVYIISLCLSLFLTSKAPLAGQADTLYVANPAEVGIDSALLHFHLDSLMQLGLDTAVFPGAQLLVARKGAIVYHKSFGYHTNHTTHRVGLNDLFDLASITKTVGGTLAIMKLYEDGLLDLDAPLSTYLPYFKKSSKADITLRFILAHQARLKPYIVFWDKAQRKNGKYKWRTFKTKQSKRFPIKITDQLFLHRKYKQKIYKSIRDSKLLVEPGYRYSGLAFLVIPDLVQELTGQPFDEYLYKTFYRPIGANRLVFNPLDHFSISEIVPTEEDTFFRHQLVDGTVHDENASLLGGVSANAGLFSNALDLAKILQLLLNKGSYAAQQYLSPQTVEEFTRCQFCEQENRRGLGFDKPLIEYNAAQAYTAESASPESYGHSGFTGTFYWVDPAEELIIVLLTNRVHPTRENRKLYTLNFRPTLHQLVYDSLVE